MPAPGPTPSGRAPAGATLVGCMGRRSPGRSGGRGAPGAAGRGVRWKIGCPGTGRPGAGRVTAPDADAAGADMGALYTGRGPVCGMIMRGGGAIGAAGFAGAANCISASEVAEMACADGALPADAAGLGAPTRGGTAIAGGAALADGAMLVPTGAAGALGGITTTDGGRWVAATDAGVTILGAGGVAAGGSRAGLDGPAFGNDGDGADDTIDAASGLASSVAAEVAAGAAIGGLAARARRGGLGRSLLLDGPQHIAGAGNVREVDLGLDLFFAVSGTRRSLRRTRRCIGAAAEMLPHQVGFKVFQRNWSAFSSP